MKNKVLRLAILIVCLVAISVFFIGCVSLSDEEKEAVGVYELYEISVPDHSYITKDTYTYFTMEHKSDKTCTVKSKVNSTEYEAAAKWLINSDGVLEVVTGSGFMSY